MAEVRLLGTALREAVGAKSLALPGDTLRDVLGGLARRAGPGLAERLPGDPDLRLLVNGRNATFLQGLDTPLADDDVVTVHFAGARAFPGG